jgi:hypothetical protein
MKRYQTQKNPDFSERMFVYNHSLAHPKREVYNMSATINALVEEFQDLPLDDQEYAADLLLKQLIESRREHLATRVIEVRFNYHAGRIMSGTFDKLMEDLEND